MSVAEVDHQDLWQRTTLGVAIACSDETTGRSVVSDVERIVARTVEVEVLDLHIEVVATEETGFSMARGGTRDPRVGVDAGLLSDFTVELDVDVEDDITVTGGAA